MEKCCDVDEYPVIPHIADVFCGEVVGIIIGVFLTLGIVFTAGTNTEDKEIGGVILIFIGILALVVATLTFIILKICQRKPDFV